MPTEAPPDKYYKVVRLEVSNVKRIRAVEILPTGNVVTIGGRNDQGKTSLLDSIMFCLGGGNAVCERPLREGTSKGTIVVDLDDLVITKTFTPASAPVLRVTTKQGAPVKSPQTILDSLANKISFDPLAFTRMDPEKQLETLRRLVNLDFRQLDSERAVLYAKRTDKNREHDREKAKLDGLTPHADAPKEEVSVKALMQQLTEARQKNADNNKIRQQLGQMRGVRADRAAALSELEDSISQLERQLADKKALLPDYRASVSNADKEIGAKKLEVLALVDTDETVIQANIEQADEINSKVRENKTREELRGKVAALSSEAEKLTTQIEAIDQKKQKQLSEAKFPMKGLSFDDSGVLLDGIPFNQGGTAKRIRASVTIAMALNPKLRVILIRDGSLLDDEAKAIIAEMAKERDFQFWLEQVGEGGASVVIEDGQIKEVA